MVWKVAALYIATVIGAGFASGQEIIQFFLRFGIGGIFGLVLATICLSVVGGALLKRSYQIQTRDYKSLLFKTGGKAAPFLDLLYTIFLLAGLAIMLAGGKETVAYIFGINGGQFITAVLVIFLLIRGPEQILNTSAALVPLLIVYTIYIACVTILKGNLVFPGEAFGAAIPYGMLYAGYNLGFALAVFASISELVPDSRVAQQGGWIGGLVLGGLIGLVMLALWSGSLSAIGHSVPMLFLAQQIGGYAALGYGLVLWIAMYTTAVANGYAIATRTKTVVNLPWSLNCTMVVVIALLLSELGFVILISLAYPLFGYVGLYLIYRLLRYGGET